MPIWLRRHPRADRISQRRALRYLASKHFELGCAECVAIMHRALSGQ